MRTFALLFDRLCRTLAFIQDYVSMICFVCMSIFVLTGVVMRFVLQIPFPWGEEISRYLMVVAVALGIGQGVREKAHLGVTMVVAAVPVKIGKVMEIIACIINICAYAFVTYFAWEFTVRNQRFGQKSPALDFPMYIMYGIVTFGFFLSALESLNLVLILLGYGPQEKQAEEHEEILLG